MSYNLNSISEGVAEQILSCFCVERNLQKLKFIPVKPNSAREKTTKQKGAR